MKLLKYEYNVIICVDNHANIKTQNLKGFQKLFYARHWYTGYVVFHNKPLSEVNLFVRLNLFEKKDRLNAGFVRVILKKNIHVFELEISMMTKNYLNHYLSFRII